MNFLHRVDSPEIREKLWQVAISGHLSFIKFLNSHIINHVAISIDSETSLAHFVTAFVHISTFSIFQNHCFSVTIIIKVSSASKWIEIVFFNIGAV